MQLCYFTTYQKNFLKFSEGIVNKIACNHHSSIVIGAYFQKIKFCKTYYLYVEIP